MSVTGRGGPYGCETSRISYFLAYGGEAVQPYLPVNLLAGEDN
jgi:hypothetical protein